LIVPPLRNGGARQLRLLPNIRYGTDRYPEKVARRLRALNITTWSASAVSGGYVIFNLYTGLWSEAMINLVAGLIFGTIPLLHSFRPLAAALVFMIVLYLDLFILVACSARVQACTFTTSWALGFPSFSSAPSISFLPRFLARWLRR
jgi:MASE7